MDEARCSSTPVCRRLRYATFDATQLDEAIAFLRDLPGLYVVKTDGLAAGKGVFVTESLERRQSRTCAPSSPGASFGDAGRRVVIEEGLVGPELSLLCLCDGERVVAARARPGLQARR